MVGRAGRLGRGIAVALLGLTALGRSGVAQSALDSLHPNFLLFRYASRTALLLYGAYGQGRTLLVFGMVQNPRTSYRETVGGVARNVPFGKKANVVVATAAASATDSWYAQLYLLPTWSAGRLMVRATAELYQPLQASGAQQFDLSPCSVLWRTRGSLQVGAAYLLYSQVGGAPLQEAGPTVRVGVPNGTLTAELLRRFGTPLADVRLTFEAAL
jgi:hypothetical protein